MRPWIRGTLAAQTARKPRNEGGQLSAESSSGGADLVARGSGTDGGFVVHRRAAKYKHNAGPVEWMSLSDRINGEWKLLRT